MQRSRVLVIVSLGFLAVLGMVWMGERTQPRGPGSKDDRDRRSRGHARDRGEVDAPAPADDGVAGSADPADDEPLAPEVTEATYGLRPAPRFSDAERARHRREFRSRFARLTRGGDPEIGSCLELARWSADKELPGYYGLVLRYALLLDSDDREARGRLTRLRHSLRRLPVDRARGRALRRELGPDFRLLLTPHFRLAYATEEPFARRTGALLERVYEAFFRFFAKRFFEPVPPADRLEVVLFATRAAYRRHTHHFGAHLVSTSGVFSSADNRSYFYDALSEPGLDRAHRNLRRSIWSLQEHLGDLRGVDPDKRFNITVGGERYDSVPPARARRLLSAELRRLRRKLGQIDRRYAGRNVSRAAHEIVHHLAYAAGIHGRFRSSPSWLMEGLAMHFETVDPDTGRWVGPAGVNVLRKKGFQQDLAKHQALPLRELVGSDRAFRQDRETMNRAYNAAWALFSYLLSHHDDALFDLMANLSIEVATERPTELERRREVERAFGPLRTLEYHWVRAF